MYAESRQPVFKIVTPKDAEAFLAINNFPGQRAYKPLKGKQIADNMDAGTHRRVEIAVAKVRESGVEYLMNGQHTSNAILIYGKPYPGVVSYYSCDTMEDAWRLFATFDVHASRTEQQFMKARRGIFSDERLHAVSLRVLQCCGSALYALGAGTDPDFGNGTAKSKTEKADLVERHAEDVVFVASFDKHDGLIAVPIVTAIIATARKNKERASEFWNSVATGEMLKASDPRMRLHDAISGTGFNAFRGRDRNKALYSICVSFWNSWRSGETRKCVKLQAMKSLPKVSE